MIRFSRSTSSAVALEYSKAVLCCRRMGCSASRKSNRPQAALARRGVYCSVLVGEMTLTLYRVRLMDWVRGKLPQPEPMMAKVGLDIVAWVSGRF
jgi:hypothetical protein